MEFYELFEHVDEDFNIFKPGGIWMHNIDSGEDKIVKTSNIRYYLRNGWIVRKVENVQRNT